MINVAFAVPKSGTDYNMQFVPDQVSSATFIAQIKTLQAQGKKVNISLGGATAPVSLDNKTERDSFIVSMTRIINTYNFDGIDIDLEGSSLSVSGGTISSPVDQPIINLIYAIKAIMANYYTQNNHRLILTMAPETAFVQGGQSAYGGIWGAYLPVIDALRDSLYILHVQLYNSGSMYVVDRKIYTQGTDDFIVAMCEAVIQVFSTVGGIFTGLPASKIAVGLPACSKAAGGGFTDTATVKTAIDYLKGNGTQPGSYTLVSATGYPDFRGMMTWSINWDAVSNCGTSYEFADNYQTLFESTSSSEINNFSDNHIAFYPNPTRDFIHLDLSNHFDSDSEFYLYNTFGEIVLSKHITSRNETMDISLFPQGIYYLSHNKQQQKIIKY
ncbi:MAG: chitinase [bacterium]|jgi:chitinase